MSANSRPPSDSELQRMGITSAQTMLPPSPPMLQAGARALRAATVRNKGATEVLEDVFTAMVLEGLADLDRLGATVRAEEKRNSEAMQAMLVRPRPANCTPASLAKLGLTHCRGEPFFTCDYCSGSGATEATNAPALPPTDDNLWGLKIMRSTDSSRLDVGDGSGATVPPKPPEVQASTPGHFETLHGYLMRVNPLYRLITKKGGAR